VETPEKYEAKADAGKLPDVYQARARGREFCRTEGAAHYQAPGAEPLDLIISCDYSEGFCVGGAIKYAGRYRRTRNLEDLKKAVDLLQIYCGAELLKPERREEPMNGDLKWWYTAPALLAREEALQVFRMRYDREPEVIETPRSSDGEAGFWILGPITEEEAGPR
jgi:hypothetical protein